MLHGVPAEQLTDEDLRRELTHAHIKRHDMLVDGTIEQLRNHSERTRELEAAYVARFTDTVTDAAEKLALYPTLTGSP
jgi:Family of unknown function (DUF6158)